MLRRDKKSMVGEIIHFKNDSIKNNSEIFHNVLHILGT